MNLHANEAARLLRMNRVLCTAFYFCMMSIAAADQPWQAEWIQPSDVQSSESMEGDSRPVENQWFCFRKQIEIGDVPDSVVTRIACDSKYWLWVNGKLVVREGQLKRGPTPTGTYYDALDLADHIRAGKNSVTVLVWYFGKHGFSHKSSGQPGLLFEALKIGLRSDATWHAIPHPSFGETKKPFPNYRLAESNVHFDARNGIPDWTSSSFDDSHWPKVIPAGFPPTAPWGSLTERPIPQWRDSELLGYESTSETLLKSGERMLVATLPYNAQVMPYLKVEAPAGKTISMRTDNYRGGSEYNVRTEYVTREGVQEFESPIWMNGHDVQYRLPAGVEVVDLKYRESGYDSDFAGIFECNDEFLNRLWNKAQRTLYVNMRDTYFDCPGRERAQWWGDVTLLLTESFYALDRRADLLLRKGILELTAWQRKDGTLFSPVPAGNWDNELPMQMLASVGRYGFWTYYQHTGDQETLEKVYPQVKRYVLEVWQLGDDGLVVPRKGGWTWGDWGQHKDLPLLYNGWYYLALDGLHQMATLVDDAKTAKLTAIRMASMKENFDKKFWQRGEYRSPDYQGPTDDRGHALAVVSGLADSSKHPAIRKVFACSEHASPYMEKYVLEALYRMGYPEDAIKRMKRRYEPMVSSELSTLWEGWGIGSEGFGGGSYNHGWSGGPLILLSQLAAGVSPLSPGYERFQVKPLLGPLRSVSAVVPAPVGEIRVSVNRMANEDLAIELTVPDDCTAELVLPQRIVRIEQVANDSSEANNSLLDPIKLQTRQDGTRFVELIHGTWKLVGRAKKKTP